jgi:YVTN family beta-propeller protein
MAARGAQVERQEQAAVIGRSNEMPRLFCRCLPAVLLCACGLSVTAQEHAQRSAPAPRLKTALRNPVALAQSDDGRWLYTANRRSGTISVIDATALKVVREVDVGRRLADLTSTPDGRYLLAADEAGDALIGLQRKGSELEPAYRQKVARAPVSVQVSGDGERAIVASVWSRQLTIVNLVPDGPGQASPHVLEVVELPFAPRCQLMLPDHRKLVVADAFGGRLAVVDLNRDEVESVRVLPAHNIRGLARTPDGARLLLSHQVLSRRATTSFDDIHWGNLLTNNVRSLSLAAVLDPKADLLRDSTLHQLGDVGHGTADPSGLAVEPDGDVVVALGGVNEVTVGREPSEVWRYFSVGERPTAVLLAPNGQRAYFACTFSDSIAVIDLKARTLLANVELGPRPELGSIDRGERLFHDARLSHSGWLSCHSCHTDGHTSGLASDTLSDGTYGTPKRILSLLGVADTGPWAWNGRMADLETQIRTSVQSTMQGRPPTESEVEDLAAYLRTLEPPPPKETRGEKAAEASKARGRALFTSQGCASCHAPPAYTSTKTYKVGLADEAGLVSFNPPSLRALDHGGPYFHDGRAGTLEDVFTRYRHQLKGELGEQELADVLRFLRSL